VVEAKRERASKGAPGPAVLSINCERFMVPEALFRPSDVALPQAGVAEASVQALQACHAALRPLLSCNFILSGGTCACPGMRDRYASELRLLVDDMYDVQVNIQRDPGGMAWHGGSAAAVKGWYSDVMVTKEAYDECGAGKTRRAAAR
jgi:actin-related protein 6